MIKGSKNIPMARTKQGGVRIKTPEPNRIKSGEAITVLAAKLARIVAEDAVQNTLNGAKQSVATLVRFAEGELVRLGVTSSSPPASVVSSDGGSCGSADAMAKYRCLWANIRRAIPRLTSVDSSDRIDPYTFLYHLRTRAIGMKHILDTSGPPSHTDECNRESVRYADRIARAYEEWQREEMRQV